MFGNEILADTNGWGHMNGGGGGWMWLWGGVMMALFVVLIVWLGRSASRRSSGMTGLARRGRSDRAREILDERLAKGELSPEEYRERVNELQ